MTDALHWFYCVPILGNTSSVQKSLFLTSYLISHNLAFSHIFRIFTTMDKSIISKVFYFLALNCQIHCIKCHCILKSTKIYFMYLILYFIKILRFLLRFKILATGHWSRKTCSFRFYLLFFPSYIYNYILKIFV